MKRPPHTPNPLRRDNAASDRISPDDVTPHDSRRDDATHADDHRADVNRDSSKREDASKSSLCGGGVQEAWGRVAVKLLQGVIYADDDAPDWEALLHHASLVREYFETLGLDLVVDDLEQMAYLRQNTHLDRDDFPRLFRRQPLSYEATLLCVLLRDEWIRFEEQELLNERCIVNQGELLNLWMNFMPVDSDPVRVQRQLVATLRKLEELRLVRLFEKDPPSWEIRRVLKVRLPVEELERLRTALFAEAARRSPS